MVLKVYTYVLHFYSFIALKLVLVVINYTKT